MTDHLAQADLNMPPTLRTKRVAWLDCLRVVAILCIICGHMGPPEHCHFFIHWILGMFGLPTTFFFLAAALFVKDDMKHSLKRAGIIYAAYFIWCIICFYFYPEVRNVAQAIEGEGAVTPTDTTTLWWYIEPGITVRMTGHLWFLRALAILTLLTPWMLKLRVRYLAIILALLAILQLVVDCTTGTVWEDSQRHLPFLLQGGAGLESTIAYMLGICIHKMGGIRTLTRCSELPIWLLGVLLILPISTFLTDFPGSRLQIVRMPMKLVSLLSLGLLLHRISQNCSETSFFNRSMHFVGRLAVGVFFVYVFHFIHPIVASCCKRLSESTPMFLYRWLATCSPLIVFIICYLAYLPLSRIPYLSRVLCLSPAPRVDRRPKKQCNV